MCILANLSLKPQQITKEIELPGFIVKSDVWVQSEYQMYEGLTTGVKIVSHSNLSQYFDNYHRDQDGKDILLGTEIPPGFACII